MSEGGDTRLTAEVSKADDSITVCLKNLLLLDPAPISPSADDIDWITRENVQLLVNKIFSLPKESTSDGVLVPLPALATYKIPRMQHIPIQKPKTRWDKFAQSKNIHKQKRSRLVWDEIAQDWRPRFGYLSVKQTKDKVENAVIEVKPNQDPFEDPFEKLTTEKQMQHAKQRFRELRNKAEAAGVNVSQSGGTPAIPKSQKFKRQKQNDSVEEEKNNVTDDTVRPVGIAPLESDVNNRKRGSQGLQEVMTRAKISTASYGRFDRAAKLENKEVPKKKRCKVEHRSIDAEQESAIKAAQFVVKKSTKNLINTDVSEAVVSMETATEGRGQIARELKGKSDMKRAARRSKKGKKAIGGRVKSGKSKKK